MRLALDRIRRGCIWLAVLLIIIQPLLKPDCCCAIQSEAADSQEDHESDSATCCRKHLCHGHAKKLAAVMPRGEFHEAHSPCKVAPPIPGGCDCPPDCPCQVQHVPPEVAIANASHDVRNVSEEWVACVPNSTVAAESRQFAAPNFTDFDTSSASSVSRCALLCRFVV